MHPVKLVFSLAAVAGLVFYLPQLWLTNAPAPQGLLITLASVFYLGFIAGEFVEFCADRLHLYSKL